MGLPSIFFAFAALGRMLEHSPAVLGVEEIGRSSADLFIVTFRDGLGELSVTRTWDTIKVRGVESTHSFKARANGAINLDRIVQCVEQEAKLRRNLAAQAAVDAARAALKLKD